MPITPIDNDKLLLCTGAPSNVADDYMLGQIVGAWTGRIIIMGGTTAKIVARELGRELTVNLRRDPSGLPPTSVLEGVDIISEGSLTLMALRDLLKDKCMETNQMGVKYDILRLLCSVRHVHVLEGSMVNPIHYAPNVPVNIERRSVLVRQIVDLLVQNYGKKVTLQII